MKSKILTAALILTMPFTAIVDRHGHYGYYGGGHHHHGGGNRWIAPAIIGGVIAGSALYGVTRDREREVVIERDPSDEYYRRELIRQELREEQLRQRERDLERRERQLYGNYNQQPALNSDDRCNEYYRNNGESNYYSRNCW